MLKSKVNSRFEITETVWVVSALNTGDSFVGHSVLLVEGLQSSGLYLNPVIYQAEIFANKGGSSGFSGSSSSVENSSTTGDSSTSDSSSCSNKEGVITQIRTYENYCNSWDYKQFQSKSWYVTPIAALQMIQLIKDDKQRVELSMRKEAEPLRYSLLGKHHLLATEESGHNCASWIQEKLQIAGVDVSGKSKPAKVASSFCVML